jgi:hypothetical protein
MGKTTLMCMIKKRLQENTTARSAFANSLVHAWKHDKEESLWAALVLEILRQVREASSPRQRALLWWDLNRERSISGFWPFVSLGHCCWLLVCFWW